VAITVANGLEALEQADLVVVLPYARRETVPEEAVAALRAAHERGAWIMSICTGAFALGQAGLLDGRRATTHWMHTGDLARRYPAAEIDPAALYVEDGRVLTSAGTAAGIDAGLHLIRREVGADVAANIARRMVMPPHREGGQAQYIERPLPETDAESLGELLDWMNQNLDVEQTVDSLAARALMSPRTFARRFRAETGTTPAAWLTQQRLQRARELLETTDLPVDRIAETVGFGGAAVLRHHFARSMSTTPQAYRRQFGGISSLVERAS
jgi:transcriptional regulator GlxA family with amidase domain